MRIFVLAKPGARQPRVEKTETDEFVVAVKQRAHEGQANEAIERTIAKHFGVPPSAVRMVSGFRSRQKVVEIDV